MGTPVSRPELQPGDLVFFHGLGHMGIYIGGGNFIHAPRTGDVVKISSISGLVRSHASSAPAGSPSAIYLLLKALLSGAVVAAASEVARRSTLLGAVLVSLPLVSILALVWLYRDTGDPDEVASLSWSILWVIVPSVVFFVVLPLALRRGIDFWPSLALACALTALAYAVWVLAARRLGLELVILSAVRVTVV